MPGKSYGKDASVQPGHRTGVQKLRSLRSIIVAACCTITSAAGNFSNDREECLHRNNPSKTLSGTEKASDQSRNGKCYAVHEQYKLFTIDSGSDAHVCRDYSLFTKFYHQKHKRSVATASGVESRLTGLFVARPVE